jgi:hypothetical protein
VHDSSKLFAVARYIFWDPRFQSLHDQKVFLPTTMRKIYRAGKKKLDKEQEFTVQIEVIIIFVICYPLVVSTNKVPLFCWFVN